MLRIFYCLIIATVFISCKSTKGLWGEDHSADVNTFRGKESDVFAALASRCAENDEILDRNNEKCISKKEHCDAIGDGSIWLNNICLSLEDQCNLQKETAWSNGVCKSAKQACAEKDDDSEWYNGECLSTFDACAKKGYRFKWLDSGSCTLKTFLDFCQQKDVSKSLSATLTELKRSAMVSLNLNENPSCLKTHEWLLLQSEISLKSSDIGGLFNDLSPLMEYKQIRKLTLANNQISDLFPLSQLPYLEYLDLQNNLNIEDLSYLSSLVRMKELYLGNNKIYNLSFLKDMSELVVLSLPVNRISDLSQLSQLVNLNSLNLSTNPIQSIAPLKGLKSLKTLNIENTPLYLKEVVVSEESCPMQGEISVAVKNVCTSLLNP